MLPIPEILKGKQVKEAHLNKIAVHKEYMERKERLKLREQERIEENKKIFKPCPFCGSYDLEYKWQLEFIRCNNCNATGPITKDNPTEKELIKSWNRRK